MSVLGGIKKPLNMMENPVYPDIKKAPPRFVWSRKHWDVDVGQTLRETETMTQFYEPAVLAQSRDYNRTVYGQSSHRDIVNAEFRPPLLSPYEDLGPLSRVPATIHAIIPHINPSTAGHDGTSGYTAKNQRVNNIEKALTDRIKAGEWRATFYAPIDMPMDNSVLPDLEMKIPSVSAHAGWEIPVRINAPIKTPDLGDEKLNVPLQSGYRTDLRLNGNTGRENLELRHNRPQVSATAGMNNPVLIDAETRVDFDLDYNRPQVSATAGINTPIQINADINGDAINLETQIVAPIGVLNPGSESGYKERMEAYTNVETYIGDNRPMYSYAVPAEVPAFREQNVLTHRPNMRQRLQPQKSYGQISQSGGYVPRAGLGQMENMHIALKKNTVMANKGTTAKYSF